MTRPTDPPTSCFCASPASHTEPEQTTIDENWPSQDYSADGSALLDPIETTFPAPSTIPESTQTDADLDLARSFRHQGWSTRREKTRRALKASGFPAGRLLRFSECGSTAYVLRAADDSDHFRIASNRCHDRFCVPCSTEHTRVVALNLLASLPAGKLRFITLTQKSSDVPLRVRLDKLYADFRRLRKVLCDHEKLTGGIAFLEVSRNAVKNQWHPHLHVIAAGSFIPQGWLRDRWLEITGDSFIVDVRLIRDKEEAALYITKYATKTLSAKVWNDHDALCEAIQALSGRRAFNVFGDWIGFKLSRSPTDDTSWVYYTTLPDLLRSYRAGDAEARRVLSFLTFGGPDDSLPLDLSTEQGGHLPGL